ncbi:MULTISPECIES: S41 family peptidase [Trichocoleus]|uniref:S41 family peptidase n=1 Tax=Trichocoleus desertorum GB2-A4 TaxID=2933944 RepID=A0ABV0JGP4_9CYAN|nr:S41 family peptidase [Trichocoleus sp. FACHB-46]MBD1865640.1 PDZ domain-containing protein [Trichocoleus sp. FACHB-46]
MTRFLRATKLAAIALVGVAALLLFWFIAPGLSQSLFEEKVFDEVWQTVHENFYDENFNGIDWVAMREQYRPQAKQTQTRQQLAVVVNRMLAELQTSHTHFYTPEETAYYQLLGIFQPQFKNLPAAAKALFPKGKYEYTGIGIFTKTRNRKTFVSAILEGSPAAIAGLKVGDELLSVDDEPYQPIESFMGKAGQSVTLLIQRSVDPKSRQTIRVIPQIFDTTTLFREAQQASTQVIKQQNKRIGYIHIWSNAADFHQQQMIEELMFGKLAEVDGLVLDIRDGWGGGSIDYLNFFTGASPSVTNIQRDGRSWIAHYRWRKPVVLLINEGSRSSKEIIAFGFQQSHLGDLVGTTTAGAVVAGRGFVMQDGSLLYVAVSDVLVDGKQRLEGKGVSPTIPVPFPLEYAAGFDPQKQQAIAALMRAIEQQSPAR